jgi:hypothetical protein
VTDCGSVIHHPRPRSGVGVGGSVVGFYDVPRHTSGDDILSDTSSGDGKGADSSRNTSCTDGDIETEAEGGYDTAPSQLSRERDGDGDGDEPSIADLPLPPSHTQ